MDPFLAVACFQKGVSHFALGEMADACHAFDLAQKVKKALHDEEDIVY